MPPDSRFAALCELISRLTEPMLGVRWRSLWSNHAQYPTLSRKRGVERRAENQVGRAVEGLRRRFLTEHIGRPVDSALLAGSGLVGRLHALRRG